MADEIHDEHIKYVEIRWLFVYVYVRTRMLWYNSSWLTFNSEMSNEF